MNKIRVVWICHFSNAEVQQILKPSKKVNEYASWIPLSLKYIENNNKFEINIIAPHEYIRGIHQFDLREIHYYFFNPYMPIIGRHWPKFFKWDYISNFAKSKRIVRRLINQIKPDVIHLQGAENPYYSSTVLQFIDKHPTVLTVQGFFSHSSGGEKGLTLKRMNIEQEILQKIPVAFYRTKKMAMDIQMYNPNVHLFWHTYGSFYIDPIYVEKKYDIVFFARISKDKGIVDLLKAISILKNKKSDINLCVIGGGDIVKFQYLAIELGINENVIWAGFLPTQKDVHQMAAQAKISVLPTYFDIIPGTIIESMFLGIPVVSYAVDSIPEVNEKGEVISLVEKGDIEALAKAMEELLDNEALRLERSQKAMKRAKDMFSFTNDQIVDSLYRGYIAAIEDFEKK